MCTSPILIRNRKFRSLTCKTANSFIKVPCGICDECLRKRAKDLYLRARFAMERSVRLGGSAYMCTLTYDDCNVPCFHGHMVFNKRDVIKFVKRLRTNLDRFYEKHYNMSAPDFKYLITSEYGTNPFATHRPHYHCLFGFDLPLSFYAFRKAFSESLVNRKTGKRYFGKIFQCEPLDLSKGGVKYSTKYILKDSTYATQDKLIRQIIKYKTHFVNNLFNIIEFPETPQDFFYNKCVRSRKDYKKAISSHVGVYRDMLQFYLVSNDFGVTEILERYGENIFSLGMLNVDKLPYAIPKSVVQKIERIKGSDVRDVISKAVFLSHFRQCGDDLISRQIVSKSRFEFLYNFCEKYIQPRYGSLYFVSHFSPLYKHLSSYSLDDVFEEFSFFDDNDFFALRNEVVSLVNLSNSSDNLEFRAALARDKSLKERERYIKRKFNQS